MQVGSLNLRLFESFYATFIAAIKRYVFIIDDFFLFLFDCEYINNCGIKWKELISYEEIRVL